MSVDWATVASVGTAAGTLVLAISTFGSTRAANRAARINERGMLAALRPVLASSRLDDPQQKVHFIDDHWQLVSGGEAAVEVTDEAIYLSISLRNVGAGMAVLHSWMFVTGRPLRERNSDTSDFRQLTRDLYIPPGEVGFWQGAFRDNTDPVFTEARKIIEAREPFTIEMLYGDHEGGQRVITLFTCLPRQDTWYTAISQHWNIDRDDPR